MTSWVATKVDRASRRTIGCASFQTARRARKRPRRSSRAWPAAARWIRPSGNWPATSRRSRRRRWEESPDNAASYEVVWRDTTAPRWEHAQAVGAELKYKTDISKDNYFFGVRAMSSEGHRSLVVFPKPPARRPVAPPDTPPE